MPDRRRFLQDIAGASCVMLAPTGLLRAAARVRRDSMIASEDVQSMRFIGSNPGEEKVIEGVALCWCPAGRFLMGSPPTERGRRPDETQVDVTLSKGFWTGKTEVTQEQWQRIVGKFPDQLPSEQFGKGEALPVYWINYQEAEGFCRNLTQRAHAAGTLPANWEFRLPTEAQWEYACRAGTRTASSFGNTFDVNQVNYNGAWERADRHAPARGSSRRVGSFPSNAWGIHDMHGNVWEWCRDWYHSRLPGGTDPDLHDTRGVPNGDGTYSRVRRGGAWIEDGWACRSACRMRYEPPRRSDHIGFRVVAVEY